MNGKTFSDKEGHHRIDVVQTVKGWLVTHRVVGFYATARGAVVSMAVHSVNVPDEQHAMRITDFKPEDFLQV